MRAEQGLELSRKEHLMTHSAEPTGSAETSALKHTPLFAFHEAAGAKMVPFAGYLMPVHYPAGILAEHRHTREKAGLFDVSHMGLAELRIRDMPLGSLDAHDAVAAALETLVPGEIQRLGAGRLRYTVFLNEAGGILDDLMVTRPAAPEEAGRLSLVVNAAVKDKDYALIGARIGERVSLEILNDMALLALQGPAAAGVLARLFAGADDVAEMPFMSALTKEFQGVPLLISRCGYTGEDGFEIRLPAEAATNFAERLVSDPDVALAGLGARDSLRLEAGLCLYGHDIDETTSPVEAGLGWVIGKRRREAGDFPGATRILRELAEGPSRRLVGLRPQGRVPAREGTEILDDSGQTVGQVTSGGFGPTVGGPIAMGYVPTALAAPGTQLTLRIRGKAHEAEVVTLPFVPHRYFRKKKAKS